jgi:hypothetical protein
MRIVAFITHSADLRHILEHIGVDSEPPNIAPARGPPLWDGCEADAQWGEGGQALPDGPLSGMGQRNQPQTTRSINVSVGDGCKP